MWPGDLVFDPMWPSFKHDLEIIKSNILSKIHDDCFKNVTSRVFTRFSFDLARWPSFLPQVTSFELDLELIKTNILSKIHDDCFKNLTARVLTRFSFDLAWWPSFWPKVIQFQTWPRNHQDKHFEQDSWWLLQKSDLVFDSKLPSFKLDLEIIKTNILSKIHDDCFKNVTARVLTPFSFDLVQWPSFWPQVTQFTKHFEQYSWWLLQKCDL